MKCFIILLFFVGLSFPAIADDPILIRGIIKDKKTQDFIPFAHVVIGDKVTTSNVNGEFSITIDHLTEGLELKISYVGYETYTEPIKSNKTYYEILIEPSVIQLESVTARSGPQIMKKVFDNMYRNYIMEPQQLLCYYKEIMKDSTGYCYSTEGIMDIYTPSNLSKSGSPVAHLLRYRKKIFKDVYKENILSGNASDMAHSSIWRSSSFLSEKNRNSYDYFYDGISKIGTHDVFLVDFEPKNKKGNTSGRLHIDGASYAILKIEYFPNTISSSYWDEVTWVEEYELIEGSFQLVYVKYDGMADKGNKNYSAILIVDDAFVNYDVPERKTVIGIKDSFVDKVNNDDSHAAFWDGYHAIKLNDRVGAQIKNENYDF